jgi:competence protein ComEC
MNPRLKRAPAFRSAVFLAGGILLQDALPLPPSLLFALATICTVPLLLSLWLLRRRLVPHLAAFLCLSAGISLGAAERLSLPALPGSLLGERVVLAGDVAELSRPDDRHLRMVLEDPCIVAESSSFPVRGAMLGILTRGRRDPDFPPLAIGMRVYMTGTLFPISGPRNPGEFDSRRWALANGIAGEVMGRSPDHVVPLDAGPRRSLRFVGIYPLRRALLGLVDRTIGGQEGEFLKGLLIGERSGITSRVNDDFIRAGVAHVLAVSGSNVAVVAGFFAFLLSMTGLGRPVRSILLAGLLVGYMLLSGGQPPVVRATVMAMVALAAVCAGERINVLNSLGVSALVILAINAGMLFDVGFQLSFVAVLSLIILYPQLNRVILIIPGQQWWKRILRGGLRVMAVTLAATLGTLPLTAGIFGRVSVIGLVANIVVVPATGVSVLLGGVTALSAPLSENLAFLFAAANWGVLRFTLWFTHFCALPTWASLETPWFRAIHSLPFLAGLYTVFSWGAPSRFRASFITTLALVLCADAAALLGSARGASSLLRLTMFDVGQGDAILVDTPRGKHLLVDCGPSGPQSDAGRRTLVPYLAREGIDTLDWIVVTHEHLDHIGGFRSLLRSIAVRAIGAPPYLASSLSVESGRTVRPLSAGETIEIDPSIRCHVLSPSRCPGSRKRATGNDGSVVLRLQYGATDLLLTGDAAFAAEEEMVERFGSFLHADCIKIGHHGSSTSTSDQFLSLVAPRLSLISVGRNNRFHHPAKATLMKLRLRGARILRTDISGAAVLESDGAHLSVLR